MAALGSASLASTTTAATTATTYGSPDYGVLIDPNVALSAAAGTGFEVPEVGIIWPNGVNV